DDHIYDLFTEAAFPGQPIGRTILGTPQTVGAFSSPMLDDYLDRHYRGPDMVLAAAGAIDHDRLVELADARFGDLGATEGPKPPVASYRGGERHEARDHLQETQLMIGFEGVPYNNGSFYTAQLLAA